MHDHMAQRTTQHAEGAAKSSLLKLAAATALYAVVHSALASRQAKALATRLLGERSRNAFYRPFYLAQSVVALGALYAYARRLPDRTLYDIKGPVGAAMHAGRAGAILYAVWSANQVGISDMLGITSWRAWRAGADIIPPEPEAQGPAADGANMKATGPFVASRHPLNLAPLPVFWLAPRMTRNLLVFNLVSTAYLVVGSMHEEARLKAAYGDRYTAYQHSGVRFYVPGVERRAA